MPFATSPSGVVITEDDRALVWLPEEHRPYVLDINQNLQNFIDNGPDSKLKAFNEKALRSRKESLRFKLQPVFQNIRDTLWSLTRSVASELVGDNQPTYSDLGYDSAGLKCTMMIEIYNHLYTNKNIVVNFLIQGSLNNVIISFSEDNKDKYEHFTYNLNSIDWLQLKKNVRDYILDRVEQLAL